MTPRGARWTAWSLWAAGALTGVLGLVIAGRHRPAGEWADDVAILVAFLVLGAVGCLVVSRHQERGVGWVLVAVVTGAGAQYFAGEYAHLSLSVPGLPAVPWAVWFTAWGWVIPFGMTSTFLLLLFPDGRLPSRRWRSFAYFVGAVTVLAVVGFGFAPRTYWLGAIPNPVHVPLLEPLFRLLGDALGWSLFVAAVLGSVVSLDARRRRADGQRRQQLKWFLFGAAIIAVQFVLVAALEVAGASGTLVHRLVNQFGGAIGLMTMAAAVGIGILRHRLFDIDLVINRALVYGILVVFVTALYLAVVVGLGALVGSGGNVFLSIVATALIAIAFHPVRERVRRFANRLVYGKRATPYEVLGEFAERMGETYAIEQVLPRMARLVGEGTGARRSEVWLRVGEELRSEASWPETEGRSRPLALAGDRPPDVPDADRVEPVLHQGELLGMVTVAKPRGESVTAAEEKLIAQVASQAGLVLRNVRLIEDLQASRQRLVAAQDEERRRLERNIHDGAQQQLVALTVKMRLVQAMAQKDPAKAAELADQAKSELQDALDDLRDLARGIYPPLLADQGLAAALEAQARKAAVAVEVHPDGAGRYPQEVEAGAYFCVLEALQNVAKYAEANHVDVSLRHDGGHLVFEVRDDGKGFDPARTPHGSGLTNMRDRLEALGGSVQILSRPGEGTTVSGRIPVTDGGSA